MTGFDERRNWVTKVWAPHQGGHFESLRGKRKKKSTEGGRIYRGSCGKKRVRGMEKVAIPETRSDRVLREKNHIVKSGGEDWGASNFTETDLLKNKAVMKGGAEKMKKERGGTVPPFLTRGKRFLRCETESPRGKKKSIFLRGGEGLQVKRGGGSVCLKKGRGTETPKRGTGS